MFDSFIKLKPNRSYRMTYSRIEIDLLGEGYDTNCKDYNKGPNKLNMLRSECITSCLSQVKSCPLGTSIAKDRYVKHPGIGLPDLLI